MGSVKDKGKRIENKILDALDEVTDRAKTGGELTAADFISIFVGHLGGDIKSITMKCEKKRDTEH